ncbi:helix-turn-helix domain-containing protein [Panacagrimonas sp.]|uniref:helix-turn-helix domain-containing protein n=1 Tax=Panacagrimonas sp. TaxID=2480088 RepID=UPI003B52DF09
MAGKKKAPSKPAAKPARGRPSKFKDEMVDQARKLANKAFTDAEVAEFFNIPRTTLYRWMNDHPELRDALKLGKVAADERVERSLYERATGYSHPDVHVSNYQGAVTLTPINKVYPPDTTAMIFWLKNRRPEEWRDKVDHEHGGPNGGPIQVASIDTSKLSTAALQELLSVRRNQAV